MMLKSPVYKAWDREVLDAYVNYALCDVEGGNKVALKMPKFQVRPSQISVSESFAVRE